MTSHLSDERRRAGGKDSRIYGPDFRRSTLGYEHGRATPFAAAALGNVAL